MSCLAQLGCLRAELRDVTRGLKIVKEQLQVGVFRRQQSNEGLGFRLSDGGVRPSVSPGWRSPPHLVLVLPGSGRVNVLTHPRYRTKEHEKTNVAAAWSTVATGATGPIDTRDALYTWKCGALTLYVYHTAGECQKITISHKRLKREEGGFHPFSIYYGGP